MASPFDVFRKHQKWMVATLGLMAMIAFVFLPIIMKTMGNGSRRNRVVVTTKKFGDLRDNDVWALISQRQRVLQFSDEIAEAVRESKRESNIGAKDEDRIGDVQAWAAYDFKNKIGPANEQVVVNAWLCAEYAKQMGMVVSDSAVHEFIKRLSEDRVRAGELKVILTRINVSEPEIFGLLQQELLAMRLREMFNRSLYATTPAQRWDYFKRLQRRATIEVIPVPVADYVDQVTQEPEPNELEEFFEKYKEQESVETSPDPGFREPHRIEVAYFKAEIDKLVTEEEIRKHYEENKEEYDGIMEAFEASTAPKEVETQTNEEQPPAEEKDGQPSTDAAEGPADEKAEGTEADEKAEGTEAETESGADNEKSADENGEAGAEEEAPAGGEPAGKDQGESAEPPSAEESPAEEGKQTDPPAAESDPSDMSSSRPASRFVLTSLLQEETADEDKRASEPSEEPEKKETGEGDETPPGEGLTEPSAPPAETPPKAEDQPGDKKEEGPKEEEPAPEDAEPEDPLKGRLGNLIRHQLARDKVDEIFGVLQAKMRQYQEDTSIYDPDDPAAEPPVELDFDRLAKQHGIMAEKTPLMSQREAANDPLGKSSIQDDWRRPFGGYAFNPGWDLYLAERSSDAQGDRYLFWKIRDEPERIRKFDEEGVYDLVLAQWKNSQARELARQEAQRLAETASKTGKSLGETFIGRPDIAGRITESDSFSWMTRGLVPAMASQSEPRISSVTGVSLPGDKFMRTVFGLEEGQIGVAMNHPESAAYVVRVKEFEPSDSQLWDGFTADLTSGRYYSEYAAAGASDQRQVVAAWMEGLRADAGMKWNRKAGQPWPKEEEDE